MLNNGSFLRWHMPFIGLALCLLIPSTDTVQKYLGSWAVAAFLAMGFVALLLVVTFVLPKLLTLPTRWALVLIVSTFVGLIVLFAILYPIAQAGTVGGGSDADDALNIAATRLMQGQYPYYARTYLNNPIAPLPGAVVLSAPFVLLGNSALQNLFWLAVFCFVVARFTKSTRVALVLLWAVLVFSPSVLANIVTGTDHPANVIYVLVFTWWMMVLIPRPDVGGGKKLIPSLLLGVALSSRSNFILILPLLFSALAQCAGWRQAAKYLAVTCVALAAMTVPFWVYDPPAFAPLAQQSNKVGQFRALLPQSGVVIPIGAAVIALALSFQKMTNDCVVLFRNCAVVQAFPVLCVIVLSSVQAGRLNLVLAGYGVFATFFGLAAYGAILASGDKRRLPLTS